MSNHIYKEVRAGMTVVWQQKAEEHALNGKNFVVRNFNRQHHWAFLEQLRDRFQLAVTFNALERAAYFNTPTTDVN
jgi:hypothetical protein